MDPVSASHLSRLADEAEAAAAEARRREEERTGSDSADTARYWLETGYEELGCASKQQKKVVTWAEVSEKVSDTSPRADVVVGKAFPPILYSAVLGNSEAKRVLGQLFKRGPTGLARFAGTAAGAFGDGGGVVSGDGNGAPASASQPADPASAAATHADDVMREIRSFQKNNRRARKQRRKVEEADLGSVVHAIAGGDAAEDEGVMEALGKRVPLVQSDTLARRWTEAAAAALDGPAMVLTGNEALRRGE